MIQLNFYSLLCFTSNSSLQAQFVAIKKKKPQSLQFLTFKMVNNANKDSTECGGSSY